MLKHYLVESLLPYKKIFNGDWTATFGKSKLIWNVKNWPKLYKHPLLEMHIGVAPEEQAQGKAAEMIYSLIKKENAHVYFSHTRILNPQVYSVINKLKKKSDLEVIPLIVQNEEVGLVIRPR